MVFGEIRLQVPEKLYLFEFRNRIQAVFFEIGKIVLDDIIDKKHEMYIYSLYMHRDR